MREIKFRGKRIDNGEWAYGCLAIATDGVYICEFGHFDERYGVNYGKYILLHKAYKIEPDTVGQYTGLHDKNGAPIYEGDIVCYNGGKTPSRARMVVKWEDESLLYSLSAYKEAWAYELGECYPSILEVIGNIHDNPELISK